MVATEGPEPVQATDLWSTSLQVSPPFPQLQMSPTCQHPASSSPSGLSRPSEVTEGPSYPSEEQSQVLPLLVWAEADGTVIALGGATSTQPNRDAKLSQTCTQVSSSHTFGRPCGACPDPHCSSLLLQSSSWLSASRSLLEGRQAHLGSNRSSHLVKATRRCERHLTSAPQFPEDRPDNENKCGALSIVLRGS